MSKKPRAKNKELNFGEKIKLIEEKEKTQKSEKRLAEQFEISKSQVHRILLNKDNILKQKRNRNHLKRSRVNRKSNTT